MGQGPAPTCCAQWLQFFSTSTRRLSTHRSVPRSSCDMTDSTKLGKSFECGVNGWRAPKLAGSPCTAPCRAAAAEGECGQARASVSAMHHHGLAGRKGHTCGPSNPTCGQPSLWNCGGGQCKWQGGTPWIARQIQSTCLRPQRNVLVGPQHQRGHAALALPQPVRSWNGATLKRLELEWH